MIEHPRYALALALLLVGCRKQPKPEAHVAVAPLTSAPPDAGRKTRRGGMDVTFVVVSDTHVGYLYPDDTSKLSQSPVTDPMGLEKDDAKLIARVNTIAGKPYPAEIGGNVAAPRGLVITGDLTEWGRKHEWERFVSLFGLQGTEGPLRIPVFEMVGNHDKVDNGPWIADQVGARHGGRFYSWDWDDLHLVALGEAPDDEGLRFLARDIERLAPDVPIVVFFHLAILGPWSTGNWFDDSFKERLRQTLAGRNVAAIFHGHHHATGHYVWQSFDVFKPGAVKNNAHTFAVVHVTDDEWTLGSYDWESERWASAFRKKL